jgi:hypothetical protein
MKADERSWLRLAMPDILLDRWQVVDAYRWRARLTTMRMLRDERVYLLAKLWKLGERPQALVSCRAHLRKVRENKSGGRRTSEGAQIKEDSLMPSTRALP